jgi:peroxiredoxin (alkyl hydroperoxide reductase subunit C)
MIQINSPFPEYHLKAYLPDKDEIKEDFSNADLTNKWTIYIFYPADFTFICPTELEDAATAYPFFHKLGAEVVSVSRDTAWVHKAWHDNSAAIRTVKYPMLADVEGKLCGEIGSLIETGKTDAGLSQRTTIIVDPDGMVKSLEMNDNDIGRNIDETLRKLQAAQFVRENKGALVCPAKWHPGDKTLKPGVALVGKI